MGLDIYAYALPAERPHCKPLHYFHYWRKHYALADWCSMLAMERGEEEWSEPARAIELTRADLDRFEDDLLNGELPRISAEYGVGIDPSGIDWTPHDMLFISKARLVFGFGRTVEIVGSW